MSDASSLEYVDGSIYRVKLHNFLTYSDAEFRPGPRLNLILGPNGTGKSSIVCALCVGLAGSTRVLGRADKVGQFVRHESTSGYTEIELFFERGHQVIRRTIYRDHTSTWHVNGQAATLTHVLSVMTAARIQMDNLCQFLPQDKVGEFARMNPVQLLRATERALSDGALATTHETLMELQQQLGEKRRELEHARAALEHMKRENAAREQEVERVDDYEARRHETEIMEKKCLWLEFEDAKRQVEDVKEEKRRYKDAMMMERRDKVEPLVHLLKKESIQLEDAKTAKAAVDTDKRQLLDKLRQEKSRIDAMESAQDQTSMEVKELETHHVATRRKLERLERDLVEWQKERDAMGDEALLKSEKEKLEKEQRAKTLEETELRSKREALTRELVALEKEESKVRSKVEQLQNEDVQRRLALQKVDPDSIRAAEWVHTNQHRLKRKVWGPIALEMKLEATLHAKYLEDTLPKWLLGALVTECYDDYNTILRELQAPDGHAAIKASILNVENGQCHAVHRPYPAAKMTMYREQYGMLGFLDELVSAPAIVHEVLRAHGGLHTVLVGSQLTEDLINQGGNLFDEFASAERKAAFVTPSKKYVTSVSKYGNRNVTTRTNDLLTPRLLAASMSNEDELATMQHVMDELASKKKQKQDEMMELREQEKEYADAQRAVQLRLTAIRAQRKALIRLDEKLAANEAKRESFERDLAQDVSKRQEALTRKLKHQAAKQAQQLQRWLELLKALHEASAREASCALCLGTQQVRVECLAKYLKQTEAAYANVRDAYKKAKAKLFEVARRAMHLKHVAESKAPWEDYVDAFRPLPDDLEALRGQIENNRAALACFRGDRTIRELYERVRAEIAEEEARVAELARRGTADYDSMDAIKTAWHTKLRDVVQHINASFRAFFRDLGCVGEVVLEDDHDDVAKWGIQRRAQFRPNTNLTIMTAEAQSGGEKSVGTIMYLMALQTLTACPFRVVDEINQGMDVHNERKVFERITASSCGAKLPQYFLITPKLVTGLRYHRDTTVLIILNGPYNHMRQDLWDVPRFLQRAPHGRDDDRSSTKRRRGREHKNAHS